MRGEQHCFHGFNPGRLQPISILDPQRYTIELRDADCPPEHFHDTKTTYHVIADSRPHATLTISLLSECHCNVIRFTDITPLEDIESGTDHPTDLDADPKQVNAYQIFREASFQITYPGDRNRSNLTTVNSLAEARDIYNNHASKDATGGTLSESIDTYAGRTMLANAPAFRDLCRGTVSDYLDATSPDVSAYFAGETDSLEASAPIPEPAQ